MNSKDTMTVLLVILGCTVLALIAGVWFFATTPQFQTPPTAIGVDTVDVVITDVAISKHSRVQGKAYFGKYELPVMNSKSGYYYRRYSLIAGDTVEAVVSFYQQKSLQSNRMEMWGEADFSTFETSR